MKCQAGWIISCNKDFWEKYQQPQICRWYHSNGKKWRETKAPLDQGERREWKSLLKAQYKNKIIASGPITSWQIEEEKLEAVPSLLSFGSKITADSDYSHEIKKCLFLEKKPMTNIDSVLKSREITLPKNVCLVKVMVFPVVMYGCESLAIKKAEHWRTDAFENCGAGEDLECPLY